MLSLLDVDRDQDLAYISLRPELYGQRGSVARSKQVADDIILDFDAEGQVIGIEFLNASAHLDLDQAAQNPGDLVVGVKEAAELAGVERSNFVRDYANKEGFPSPVADLGSGRLWLKADVLRHLGKQSPTRVPREAGLESIAAPAIIQTAETAERDAEGRSQSSRHSKPGLRIGKASLSSADRRMADDSSLTARAKTISQFKKERFLLSYSVSEFLNNVLRPLFTRQGLLEDVPRRPSGLDSLGAVFVAVNPLGMKEVYFVLAHRGSISLASEGGGTVENATERLSNALKAKVSLTGFPTKQLPSKVVFCLSGRLNDRARDRITQDLADPRGVLFDANHLIGVIDEKYPELWLDMDVNLPPYLSALKRTVEEFTEETLITGSQPSHRALGPVSDQLFVQLQVHRTTFRMVKNRGRIEREPRFEELPINAIVKRRERLVLLLGEAGSGKSTCLRRLTYVLAERGLKIEGAVIPVLLRATDVWGRRPRSLVDLCAEYTMRVSGSLAPSFSSGDLSEGRVTILIDSLDELADDSARRSVAESVLEFHRAYPSCQVVMSSREYAFVKNLDELALFERFRISPIGYRQAEQILGRLQRSKSLPKEVTKEILRRLQDIHGMELNPLLVTIFAATSESSRRDIPANITELFKKFTEMMLGRWDAGKGLAQQYHAPLKDFILRRIAFEMHRRRVTSVGLDEFRDMIQTELLSRGHKADVEELLSEILDRSGLFRIGSESIEFRHHLLQEFFAGRGIPSSDFLDSVISSEWWQRAIVFYFGENPSDTGGLHAVINSLTVRPVPELYRAAITLGLALQACYLVEVKDKLEILKWVIEGLADSKDEFLAPGERVPQRPLTSFVLYYIFGRDSVACSILEEKCQELLGDLSERDLTTEERDSRAFWIIIGLIESGSVEVAEKLIKTFRPDDARLDLAIHLGCFLIQHLRVATPQQQRAAQRISDSLGKRVLPLRSQLLTEFRAELLEVRKGEVRAIEERTEEVGLP